MVDTVVDFLNTVLWGYVILYGLLAAGLFFTIRLGFPQIVHFGEMWRVIFQSRTTDKAGISPFQALSISLASRVGTGNIAGVAVAITLGGAGAVFWMWVVAVLGMATAYAESTLAQLYKVRDRDGAYRGGPAFYMQRGLRARWAGWIFSVCLILSFGLIFNAVQANAVAEAAMQAFGVPQYMIGIGVAALAGVVIFGGVRSIARVAELIVPFMAGLYMLMALYILIAHFDRAGDAIALIVRSAFGLEEATGGVVGSMTAALLNGVKRGLFSNEAGMGSAPNIAAVAVPEPHHPSSQGFVQALGCFIDTILVCTATAVMILLSGVVGETDLNGTALTQAALTEHIGDFGLYFISIAIFFFAFSSIIGNYSYAEGALTFMGLDSRAGVLALRVALLAMVVWGPMQSVATVFNFADASMGLMATVNLVAILALSGTVAKLTRDYFAQRRASGEPQFISADYPELRGKIDDTIWK